MPVFSLGCVRIIHSTSSAAAAGVVPASCADLPRSDPKIPHTDLTTALAISRELIACSHTTDCPRFQGDEMTHCIEALIEYAKKATVKK
jgi:hypothetical protein